MHKYFFKPLRVVLGVYILAALGIASDIAQLTDFNIFDYLKSHSPQSYYLVVAGTLLLYCALVIIEIIRNKENHESLSPDRASGQHIKAHNVKNSTIIQINKSKED